MWFTHIGYFNDASEIEYTYELLLNCINELKNKGLESGFLEVISREAKPFSCYKDKVMAPFKNNDFDFYIASFSFDNDNLGLWNYYTKSPNLLGYNIGFKNDFHPKIEDYKDINTNIEGNVIYNVETQKTLLCRAVKEYARFSLFSKNSSISGSNLFAIIVFSFLSISSKSIISSPFF